MGALLFCGNFHTLLEGGGGGGALILGKAILIGTLWYIFADLGSDDTTMLRWCYRTTISSGSWTFPNLSPSSSPLGKSNSITITMCVLDHSGTHFTNSIGTHDPNLVKICSLLTWKIITRSIHNFAHAMTAELSWHVQNCELIRIKIRAKTVLWGFNYEPINWL